MFLGLAIFVILALVATVIIYRAAKALLNRLTGREQEKRAPSREAPESKKDESNGKAKKDVRSESLSEEPSPGEQAEVDPAAELARDRYDSSREQGITESFSPEGQQYCIDPKTVADQCVSSSTLTYLEFNNRELTGEDYLGFNLIIEKDTRMVLTYNGRALASLTAVELRSTAVVNGQEVEGTVPGFRINTFPPAFTEEMAPSDLVRMLDASGRIRPCGSDPALVAECMISEFTAPDNIRKLKINVDSKIQAKESSRRRSLDTAQKKPPKLLLPR